MAAVTRWCCGGCSPRRHNSISGDAHPPAARAGRCHRQPLPQSPSGIPLLATVPAGFGKDNDPYVEGLDNGKGLGYVPRWMVPNVGELRAFALRVEGDSMVPDYMPGDTVICAGAIIAGGGQFQAKGQAVMRAILGAVMVMVMCGVALAEREPMTPEQAMRLLERQEKEAKAADARLVDAPATQPALPTTVSELQAMVLELRAENDSLRLELANARPKRPEPKIAATPASPPKYGPKMTAAFEQGEPFRIDRIAELRRQAGLPQNDKRRGQIRMQIEELERQKGEYLPVLVKSRMRVGAMGIPDSLFVFQVHDANSALCKIDGELVFFDGINTSNLVNDKRISNVMLVEVVGTHQYNNVIGSTNTIFRVKQVMPGE